MPDSGAYPERPGDRDRFVLRRRGTRPALDPWRHQGVIVEDEPSPRGGTDRIATVFLTGRECPWRSSTYASAALSGSDTRGVEFASLSHTICTCCSLSPIGRSQVSRMRS